MPTEFVLSTMTGEPGNIDNNPRPVWKESLSGNYSTSNAIFGSRGSVVSKINAAQAVLDTIAARPDTTRLCTLEQLSDNIGGPASNVVRTALDAEGIPSQWVSAADSWAQTIRVLRGHAQWSMLFMRRTRSDFPPWGRDFFELLAANGAGLDTQWRNLSAALQAHIQAAATAVGWTTFDPSPPSIQIRAIMRLAAEHYEGMAFKWGRDESGAVVVI